MVIPHTELKTKISEWLDEQIKGAPTTQQDSTELSEETNKDMTNNEMTNKEMTNNEMTNKEMTNNEMTNKEMTNNEMTNKEMTNNEMTNKEMTTEVGKEIGEGKDPEMKTENPSEENLENFVATTKEE